jgi:hypothetical protein
MLFISTRWLQKIHLHGNLSADDDAFQSSSRLQCKAALHPSAPEVCISQSPSVQLGQLSTAKVRVLLQEIVSDTLVVNFLERRERMMRNAGRQVKSFQEGNFEARHTGFHEDVALVRREEFP